MKSQLAKVSRTFPLNMEVSDYAINSLTTEAMVEAFRKLYQTGKVEIDLNFTNTPNGLQEVTATIKVNE